MVRTWPSRWSCSHRTSSFARTVNSTKLRISLPKPSSRLRRSWQSREALHLTADAFDGDRPEIVAWDDRDVLQKFLDSGNTRVGPPAYREDLESTHKRGRAMRPYPVLNSRVEKLRGTVDKRVYEVLLPVAERPDFRAPIDANTVRRPAAVDGRVTGVTLVIAFNAVDGMAASAGQIAQDIRTTFESLPPDVQKASRIGFVFFRGEADDEKYVIVPPQGIADAVSGLAAAANPEYMKGGGATPSPVLDAVLMARYFVPQVEFGDPDRKMVIVAVAGDARPATSGAMHDGIPGGLDAASVARDLSADGVPVFSIQAGTNAGPDLIPVFSALADGTGGTFVADGSGDDNRRKWVAAAIAGQLVGGTGPRAPAPFKILDEENLVRLRSDGAKFNVDPAKGGILVRGASIVEAGNALEPRVQLDQAARKRLAALFSALGQDDANSAVGRGRISRTLMDIAGKDYDAKETIGKTVENHLGLTFRTRLLDFSLEIPPDVAPEQRLDLLRRIERAGAIIRLINSDMADSEKEGDVWLPVSRLP